MSKRSISENHLNFKNNIEYLIQYGLEIINVKPSNRADNKAKKERRILLEALLLRTCALWENFIEKEIVYIVNLDNKRFKENLGLPLNTKLNIKLIRAILYSDTYQDYHDIEQVKGYFKKILSDKYNPFINITNEQIRKINFTYRMRNYLSHYSDFSRKKLFEAYRNYYNYQRFLEPGLFLMKQKGEYFEKLLHNFILVSVRMEKKIRGK